MLHRTKNLGQGKIDLLRLDKSATFSEFTQGLALYLDLEYSGGLRVVYDISLSDQTWTLTLRFRVLCFEPRTKGKKGFLSTSHKVIATFGQRFHSLPLVPNYIIAFLLEQYLKEELPNLTASTYPHMHDDRRRLLRPPSMCEWQPLAWIELHDAQMFWFPPMIATTRGNLDPKQFADNHIELAWQAEAPTYTTDFDIYIWEPYKSLSTGQRAILRLYPGTDTRETALLVLFQNSKSLARFSNLRGNSQLQGSTPINTSTWSTTSEVLLFICAIYRVIILETTAFLQGCSLELEKLVSWNNMGHSTSLDRTKTNI